MLERRAVGETSLNERSSRSHAILRFVIESHDDNPQVGTASYIAYLVWKLLSLCFYQLSFPLITYLLYGMKIISVDGTELCNFEREKEG
uniref:Kinesin motor domain-containing protein n=1 Tax=Parascaris equorum TaxID=6256 RepID=A0A914REY3_PAREQ